MNYTAEEHTPVMAHRLTLENRKQLSITGVTEVESFDDTSVILHIAQDTLLIRGEALHLRSLEGGQVFVDGTIGAMVYETSHTTGGFWSRLFG